MTRIVSFQTHYTETPDGSAGSVEIGMRHVRGVARADQRYLDVKLVTGRVHRISCGLGEFVELVSRAFDAGIEFVDADSIRKPEPKLDLAEGELPF
jgi:hypothetical protein